MMTPTHEQVFQVRHYECDAYGHVNHANYLRYMQEAAFNASAAVGYSFERCLELGVQWLAHETAIEYLQPLRYGDTAVVRTRIADFRRVRSHRHYEIIHQQSGALAARAQTDWVLLDAATGRPKSIDEAMVAAYSGGDPIEPVTLIERRPYHNQVPPNAFAIRKRVEWRDIDTANHVNNAVYLNYLEDCSIVASREVGYSMERLNREQIGIMARRHQIEYRQPAVIDDEIEISTWITDFKRATGTRHFQITRVNDGAVLARAQSMWMFVNLGTGHLGRVTPEFREAFMPQAIDAE